MVGNIAGYALNQNLDPYGKYQVSHLDYCQKILKSLAIKVWTVQQI